MKDDRTYLLHIRDALDRIVRYSEAGKDYFLADERTQDAIVRNLEIVGEAAKQVSPTTRASASAVPWRAIAGLRDKLIHEYFGVNLSLVWEVVERDVPLLRREVERLLGGA